MKKILTLVLILIIALQASLFVSAQSEIGFSADTQIVYISGFVENAKNDVTILMTDNESNVKYINQYPVDADGKYSAKFELYDDIGSYNVLVRDGNKDATDSIKAAYVTVPNIFSFTVRDSQYGNRIDEGELAKALIKIDNKYGVGGTYTVGLACYDEFGKLLDCDFIAQRNYGFHDIALETEENFTKEIPSGTKKVKAFLWNNLQDAKPLAPMHKRDVGDATFGTESENVTVALMGDSITHLAKYIAPIEHYYQTRYPKRNVTFVNKGISGDTASGIIGRFEWDITEDEYTKNIDEAVMMIGMNDVGGNEVYPEDKYGIKDSNITKSLENIETIIEKCIENKISLTLVTPSAYDETDEFEAATSANSSGKNSYGLSKIKEGVQSLGDKYQIPVIDLWTPTTELINDEREKGNTGTVVTSADRIHPDDNGGFFMAYQFIKQQDKGNVVSTVDVESVTGNAIAENADVEVVSADATGVTYKYLAHSLPIAYSDEYKNTETVWGYNVTDEINKEIIRITNLEDGSYDVKMDNILLGTYTSDELAEGINISVNPNNPGQIQAVSAYEKAAKKVSVESDYRGIAFTEYTMKKNNVYTLEELEPIVNASHFTYYFSPYFGSDVFTYRVKANQSETWSLIKSLEAEARTLSVPVEHTVEITKK